MCVFRCDNFNRTVFFLYWQQIGLFVGISFIHFCKRSEAKIYCYNAIKKSLVHNMNKQELRTSILLAFVYILRLLGIFLMLPIFTLYASGLSGGDNKTLVGLAFGIYGLTQAIFQLPFGIASDYWGRKKVIFLGLLIFALGSVLSAFANDIWTLTFARSLQGAGAISSAVIALLADLTRDEVRTRAMSIIGLSIGLTFSGSLIIAPILNQLVGVKGIFILTGVLIIPAILLVHFLVPNPPKMRIHNDSSAKLSKIPNVIKDLNLWKLNFGIFALHCGQMALFVALPFILEKHTGILRHELWKIYLPVTLIGIIAMIPAVIVGETKNKLKSVLLIAIVFLAITQLGLTLNANYLAMILVLLSFYFIGLNIAEAILPSWVSKIAHPQIKGTAMGIYNTSMSLGLFSGSLIGGLLLHHFNEQMVFIFCFVLMLLWVLVVLTLKSPKLLKTLIFTLPDTWQKYHNTLNCKLNEMNGIVETAFSDDGETLYLKVLPKSFDVNALQMLLLENPEYVS